MEIVILGSGNAFADSGSYNAAHLIRYEGKNKNLRTIMLDCGPTILVSAIQQDIDLKQVDLLLISHLHGDHIAGIPFLLLHYKYKEPRKEPLQIIGPIGLKNRLKMLIEANYPSIFDENENKHLFEITELSINSELEINQVLIRTYEAQHIENAIFYKITLEGKTIAYSGDNKFDPDKHLEIIQNDVDVLIHECSFMELEAGGHTSWKLLKRYLPEFLPSIELLILVHLGNDVRNALPDLFPEKVYRAKDGSKFRFGDL